jgi:K+-sensing histidine kinase KdpD
MGELQNILVSVEGLGSIFQSSGNQLHSQGLQSLQEEIRNIQWILADAMHFLQAAPVQRQLMDLTEVMSRNLSEWCPGQGAGCTLLLEPDLPLIELDLQQIEHLLQNLLRFFGRVSAPGRSIAVRTYAAEGEVRLEITSGALEYSPEDIEPLFDFPDNLR